MVTHCTVKQFCARHGIGPTDKPTDIVERLRMFVDNCPRELYDYNPRKIMRDLATDARDEIERLRAAFGEVERFLDHPAVMAAFPNDIPALLKSIRVRALEEKGK